MDPVGPTADVGAVTNTRAPGIAPRSVGLAAPQCSHYTDSIGQDRYKLPLRTVPTRRIYVTHTVSQQTQTFTSIVLWKGPRRLMPPDALQPKAYCTNPGL